MPRSKTSLKVLSRNRRIEKFNDLNHLYPLGMTLQQVRLLTIYLSRIDRNKIDTRVVKFPLDDFERIFDIKKATLANIKAAVDGMLQNIMHVSLEYGFEAFPMFKKSRFTSCDGDDWFVEIDASDDALPLFFNYQNRFFRYKLWNALRLRSTNQVRMYEIVKEHQWHGDGVELPLDELKLRLGILPEQYEQYRAFNQKVLEVCQAAIAERTDIKFKYEPVKRGRGGKVVAIRFYDIEENKDYVDQYVIEEYIPLPEEYRTQKPAPGRSGKYYGQPTKEELERMKKLKGAVSNDS